MNFDGLSHFLSKLTGVFSAIGHTHTKSEITDYVVDSAMSSTSTNPVQNKVVNTALNGKVPTSRTINGKALSANITLSASDVGADASGTATTKADAALASAKSYTDTKVAALVDSAPATLDTLAEVATAIQENETVVEALNSAIGNKVDKVSGKGLSTNDYTTTEKNKLSGIASGAEVNQNAFSTITVGTTAIAADSKTDTFTIVAGDNVTLTPDTTNDKMTISAKDTVYTHPTYTARTGVPTANQTPAFGGTFSVSQPVSDSTGHITAVNSRTITIPNATATTSAAGLMSSGDKTKLDGIATGANKTTVDSAMSTSSTNPVQNKVVQAAITAVSDEATANYNKSITGLSVSGKTVTYTKGDGTTGTITTQDTNTDTNVTQTVTTSNASYPLLLAPSGQTATKTTTAYFDSGVTLNPSTNTIAANISGNAATATSATKATSADTAKYLGMNNCSNTDFDTIKTAGWYYGYTGMTNAAVQAISVLEVIVYSNDWIVQRQTVINADGKTYERHYYSGNTWSEWIELAKVNDNVASATKLATGRTLKVNLGSTSASIAFDGTANVSNIGVSGTLPIANGGTGATTAEAVLTNLGISATATELNYVDGVTSNIQTQLNNKASTSVASTSANGLMSKDDKIALNSTIKLDPNDTAIEGEAALVNAGTFNGLTYDAVKTDINASAPVQSVNGKTGVVTLAASDVGAAPSEHGHSVLVDGDGNQTLYCYLPGSNDRVAFRTKSRDGNYSYVSFGNNTFYTGEGYRVYAENYKPSYADIGAAAASHTHDSIMSPDCLALTWSGDHFLSSTDRPDQKLHFGTNTLYRYNHSNGTYYQIHDDGNLKFSLSGTALTITKS